MNKIERFKRFERNPFLSADEPTLADVLAHLEACDHLDAARKRDLRSAIHRFCALTHRDPAMVAASVVELKAGLATIDRDRAGISEKTFANLKSYLLAALRESGLRVAPNTAKTKLTPAWLILFELLPGKGPKNALSRFLRFCSAMGIEPAHVDDQVVYDFVDALVTGTFVDDPRRRHRDTCRFWNKASETIAAWPQRRLQAPCYREPRRSVPLADLPLTFQQDVERYLGWLADPDPFDDERPRRPLKPRTVKLRHDQIVLAASALIQRGCDVSDLHALADLVAVDSVKEILRFYLTLNEPRSAAFISGLAQMLFTIAKDWVRVDESHLDGLRAIRRRLPPVPTGMTDKNRALLRQFEDPETLRRLLLLPEQLLDEAGRCPPDNKRAAITAQKAVVIELLLMAPIRMANVIGIRLGHELLRPAGNGGLYRLIIQAADTKNGVAIEFELPAELGGMIDLYLRDYRPRLTDPGNVHLFPVRIGEAKRQETLSKQIKSLLRKRLGFPMTPHQFRHLGAWLYLRRNPGDYVTVQKLLGHKSIKTTMNFYAKLDASTAARHYDAMIEKERSTLRSTSSPRLRRPES